MAKDTAAQDAVQGTTSTTRKDKAPKGDTRKFDPKELHLVGFEDPDEKTHRLYDPRVHLPVSEKLVKSIIFRGFRGAIVVYKDPVTGLHCVVDGRQRVKACREANRRLLEQGEPPFEITAVVHAGSIESAMDVMGILNHGGQALSPGQRVLLVQRYLDSGRDEESIATMLACSVASVKNYRALLECIPEVRAAVESKQVPFTVGFPMSKLSPDKQKEKLAKMLAVTPQEITSGASKGKAKKRGTGKKQREAAGEISKRGKRELTKMLNARPEWRSALAWALGGPEVPTPEHKAEALLKDIGEVLNASGDLQQIIVIARMAVEEYFRPPAEQAVVQTSEGRAAAASPAPSQPAPSPPAPSPPSVSVPAAAISPASPKTTGAKAAKAPKAAKGAKAAAKPKGSKESTKAA